MRSSPATWSDGARTRPRSRRSRRRDGDPGGGRTAPPPLRLTWVQPEDLIGHELRQAAEDGRDASAVERTWLAAGGSPAPERAGASQARAGRRAAAARGASCSTNSPCSPARRRPTSRPAWPASKPPARTGPHPQPATDAHPGGRSAGPAGSRRGWAGRPAACWGSPSRRCPSRASARSPAPPATGRWTAGSRRPACPPTSPHASPGTGAAPPTSLAENIDGMPEDDDLNYPLLALLLLQRHGHGFGTGDVAALWLDELPAGRTFTAERVAYRNLLDGLEPPHTASHHNPFREWIGALIRSRRLRLDAPRRPGHGRRTGLARRHVVATPRNGVYGAMFVAAVIASGRRRHVRRPRLPAHGARSRAGTLALRARRALRDRRRRGRTDGHRRRFRRRRRPAPRRSTGTTTGCTSCPTPRCSPPP